MWNYIFFIELSSSGHLTVSVTVKFTSLLSSAKFGLRFLLQNKLTILFSIYMKNENLSKVVNCVYTGTA